MFGISRGNHGANKHAAILKMYELLDENGIQQLQKFRKKDDVSDAILMCLYTNQNMDTLLNKKIKACAHGVKKRKRRTRRKKQ